MLGSPLYCFLFIVLFCFFNAVVHHLRYFLFAEIEFESGINTNYTIQLLVESIIIEHGDALKFKKLLDRSQKNSMDDHGLPLAQKEDNEEAQLF